ncbi:hypothetical protein L9F63_013829 [Diploptera punctata]|uniref:Autophagy-related protein 9 n=1 Tax=Diploptera punctata TaxID=6984 RepID=A0AAD8ELP5_DIPPU|nr:hypothetical protein L9F63_013829 [Diploptera punctata]
MSATLEASYQPLQPYPMEAEEHEETPQDSGVMIHVVPENSRARWNHIEDLDSFFARMYHYHQKHGFKCMMVQEGLELFQFAFVVFFSTFLFHCVDYSILFRDSKTNEKVINKEKISISDALLTWDQCWESFGAVTGICLFVAFVFWLLRVVKVVYHLFHFWEIKQFFNMALKINDSDLDNTTWHEIQCRVREVQREQQMCIHKAELTELDIYHRILRFKNYMVAMINQNLLPLKISFPLFGETIFFTSGLKYNLEFLLFCGPWAPFENNWHLREDYKKIAKRKELAQHLSKHILWVGIANFALCPLILLWQILYLFFNYAEVIKREPGFMSLRSWSLYGRLYVRHFNELDHELNARLNRAYKNSSKYMSMFTSPLTCVIARTVCFIAGGIAMVLVLLSVYDEDVLTVEHVLTIISVCGVLAAISRAMLPDENMVWCPEHLMTAIIAQIHYCPEHWRGQAHTNQVRKEFSQMFHYKVIHLLDELVSPIITPFVLCFHLRSKSLEIVDFFRNFTVEVAGVGDVCSFALMDLRRHGCPDWQESVRSHVPVTEASSHAQADIGKTELSLVHFMYTNPKWVPPADAQNFVTAFRNRAMQDRNQLGVRNELNPLYSSLTSMSSLGVGYNSLVQSIVFGRGRGMTGSSLAGVPQFPSGTGSVQGHADPFQQYNVRVRTSRIEGPLVPERGLIYSLQQPGASLGASVFGEGREMHQDTLEMTAADMNLSTLYLHNLHHQNVRQRGYVWHRPGHDPATSSQHAETTPLLDTATKPPRSS